MKRGIVETARTLCLPRCIQIFTWTWLFILNSTPWYTISHWYMFTNVGILNSNKIRFHIENNFCCIQTTHNDTCKLNSTPKNVKHFSYFNIMQKFLARPYFPYWLHWNRSYSVYFAFPCGEKHISLAALNLMGMQRSDAVCSLFCSFIITRIGLLPFSGSFHYASQY